MNSWIEYNNESGDWIRRWSRVFYWFATVLIVMVPVGVAWSWSHFSQMAPFLPSMAGIPYHPDMVTLPMLVGAACLNLLSGLIAMYGFWQLRHLFAIFSDGQYFHANAIMKVRNFALAAMVYSVAAPITRMLIGVLMTISNPPGQRLLLLRLSSDDLVIFFLGGVFYVIARVWCEARAIADENAQII